METLRGELVSFRAVRSFWGFGIIRTGGPEGDAKVVGELVGASEGDSVQLEGRWHDHPKFGRQFKFHAATLIAPQDASGAIAWIVSRLPDVGRRRAEALVERFGVEGLWDVLERSHQQLADVPGITPARAEAMAHAYRQHAAERDKQVALRGWGLTDKQVAALWNRYGEETIETLQANPYVVIEDVRGFGWEKADALAKRMGVSPDHPGRIEAGLLHMLQTATGAGHCYVPMAKLVSMAARKALKLTEDDVWAHVNARGVTVRQLVQRGGRAYLRHVNEAEDVAAEGLRRMLGKAAPANEADEKGQGAA